jgi:hypothetical protein
MRPYIVLGLVAAAIFSCAGCGGFFLIATLLLNSSGSGDYSAGYQPYAPAGGYYQPVGPADGWQTDPSWSGRMSSGTWDRSGQGNDVISVDGEVLNLP